MRHLPPHDAEALARQADLQRRLAWDLELSIDWRQGVCLDKPLVPLDPQNLLFPGAGAEERLAISQMMGLMIASAIAEMEECLIRLRLEGWERIQDKLKMPREARDLGELFFEEEQKHSQSFQRYVLYFSQTAGIDPADLREALPIVGGTWLDRILRLATKSNPTLLWWIVAALEHEFVHIYKCLRPHRAHLDPLYVEIHQRHFEEEARHAPFPYLLLEHMLNASHAWRPQPELAFAQFLQSAWTIQSLGRARMAASRLKHQHPLFAAMERVIPLAGKQPLWVLLRRLVSGVPYVSPLVNPRFHPELMAFAREKGVRSLPFPAPDAIDLKAA